MMRRRAGLLVLLIATSCAAPPDGPEARGRERVRRDIAEGHVRLRTSGFPCDSNSGLDLESGLVRETDGCISDAALDAERAAYNAEILRAARAGEIDRWVFRDRARTPEEAAAAVARGTPVDEGASLPLDGGRFVAELSPYRRPAVPNAAGGRLLIVRAAGDEKPRIQMNTNGPVTLASDPDGKTVFVRDDHGIRSSDLATGTFLQIFRIRR